MTHTAQAAGEASRPQADGSGGGHSQGLALAHTWSPGSGTLPAALCSQQVGPGSAHFLPLVGREPFVPLTPPCPAHPARVTEGCPPCTLDWELGSSRPGLG